MNEHIATPAPTTETLVQTGSPKRPLPAPLRAANAMSASLQLDGPRLDPESLTRAAARRARLPARFESHVEEALEVFCRSIRDEARLSWFGRMNTRTLVVTGLAEMLLLDEHFRQHPELDALELNDPLIVTGLPRSGTTFLHRLLSAAAIAEPVNLAQHLYPTRSRASSGRIEAELSFFPWKRASKSYGLDAIHFVRPALPDECNFGMRLGMRSMIFWATAPAYGYLEWLLAQDLREAYRLYRRVLQLHQSRAPGRRLTLKCPHHLAWLPALCEALPEAHIVQTHRDPLQAVPSECKLILSLQSLATDQLDWRRTVASNSRKVQTFARRAVEFANTPQGARIKHIDYRELVRDPVALAGEIHAHFGLEPADGEALAGFYANNRQHKHGKNRYSLEQFELERGALDQAFADYRARFLSANIEP